MISMDDQFQNFIVRMYHENCKERNQDGVTPFENVDAYYRTYPNWLHQKFKENKEEK